MNNNNNFLYCAALKTKAGTKWGYINDKGEFQIQPLFEYAYDFQNNGLATVKMDGLYGCIDDTGQFVIGPRFETMIDFSEARATVVLEDGFHVIDETGQVLTKKGYNFIRMYQDGRAVFSNKDMHGKFRYGYLNKACEEVIPLQYESASDFKDGVAVVKIKEGKFALIDRYGNGVVIFNYFFVGNYGDNLLSFRCGVKEKYGYLNTRGDIVIKPRFTVATPFENGRAVVIDAANSRNKKGLIDKAGMYIIEPIYNDLTILGENRIAVGVAVDEKQPFLGSKYALANWNGQILSEFIYNYVSQYDQGIASVFDGKRAFFIDRSGNRARGLPGVEGADSVTLIGKLVRIFKGTRIAYLTRKGKLVWRQNTIIPITNRYRVLEKMYQPNIDYLVFYPKVDGLKNEKVQVQVNEKLKLLSGLKEISENKQLDYSYTGDFNVTFFQKNLLVMELYGDQYYFGAAHGMPTKMYLKINMINGRFYELMDLFQEDSDYEGQLSSIIENMIKTDPKYNYVFPGAYKKIAKDQPFYVNEDSLFIYFSPYEIGPYVAGFPTFEIPFSEIIDMIDKKGEFWVSFQ
ncbi:WG repeat-containing protein [Bacillaceae bacterium IKA-2]|nr:WG repeat-containing protein [Bacillaceae bacterium IKA-2]